MPAEHAARDSSLPAQQDRRGAEAYLAAANASAQATVAWARCNGVEGLSSLLGVGSGGEASDETASAGGARRSEDRVLHWRPDPTPPHRRRPPGANLEGAVLLGAIGHSGVRILGATVTW